MLETETKALLPNLPSLTPLPLVNAKHSALWKCPGNSVLQDCPKWSLGKTTIVDRGWSSPWRECTFPWIRVGEGQSRAEIEDPWGSQEERKAISLLSCLRELASKLQDRRCTWEVLLACLPGIKLDSMKWQRQEMAGRLLFARMSQAKIQGEKMVPGHPWFVA